MEWDLDELLDRLQTRDECDRIEAKEACNALGKSALETISAFSNEPDLGGGFLILGLKRNEGTSSGNRYIIQGVNDPDKVQLELAGVCRNDFNVRISPKINIDTRGAQTIIWVFIPESFSREKPVFIKKHGVEKGTYRRIGSADFLCTEDDLDLLYQLRRQCRYESEVLPHTLYEDISQEAIEEYRRLRSLIDPSASELKLNDEQLLLSLGVGLKNKNGDVTPTVAGLLLFGTKEALKRVMPACRVDYIIVEGTKWVSNSSERYKLAIEYWEPLMTLMPRLHSEIMSDLPMKFELKPGALQRTDTPLIPREVIREAIANLLMHRDYRVPQPTQIIRYSNRIEFKNAGYSLKSLEELLIDSGSVQRNQTIAKIFHDLKFAETKGTGICAMRDKLKEVGFTTPPIIETDRERNKFELILFPHHLLDENTLNWLSYFKKYNLNDSERRALAFARNVGAISNEDYRQLNGVDTLNASRGLSRLKELGILLMKGNGNATYYILSEKLAPHISSKSEGLTPHISSKSEGLTPQAHSSYKGFAAMPEDFPKLPEDLKVELKSLGKKVKRDQFKGLIKRLCRLGPLQLSQLSMIFDREPRYIRDHFLTEMIKSGDLAYLYPETPAHPKQAYRVPDKDDS